MTLASIRRFTFLPLILISGSLAASDNQCKALGVSDDFISSSCQCADAFPRLKVVAPKGTQLKAVCKLYSYEANRIIDPREERASFDSGIFSGSLYFAGTLILDGVVSIEPSDAGYLWFYPNKTLNPEENSFPELSSLKLSPSTDGPKFGLPRDVSDLRWSCSRATAKIRLQGIRVILSEQDSNGAYAVGLSVLSHSPFEMESCGASAP